MTTYIDHVKADDDMAVDNWSSTPTVEMFTTSLCDHDVYFRAREKKPLHSPGDMCSFKRS